MIDIAASEVNKYYGSNHVIRGISFEIYSGEKIGVLGKNGSGKTTLFKMITGEEPCDSGSVFKASGKSVEMLAQIAVYGENDTVDAILRSSFQEAANIFTEMKKIEGDGSSSALSRYGRLMEEYERLGGYDMEVKLDKVCGGMNIDDKMRERTFDTLSGGEKTRIHLARILLRECDILLLDEPTNHLDFASLEWLEKFLHEFSGTVVVISHDRTFLDRVVTRIIEVDNGKANFYSGNYSWYTEEKQRRFTSQSEQYERQQKEIKRIEERAKWFVEQNRFTTKHHAILSRIDHMDKVEKPTADKKLMAEFDSGGYAAKEIVSFNSVNKGYGTKILLSNLNSNIYRNDCIALVGANGCGKTTLMKMIMGEEQSDSGEIKVNVSVKPAYMPQIIEFDDKDATVLDTLRLDINLSEERARSILSGFNFRADDVIKKVGNLSGGEKSRLKLCLMMQNNINFLMLDEPTNHLDIASREWIENALTEFNGTILFVSHDRYFINKFAAKIWEMDNGVITQYDCNFDEYCKTLRTNEALKKSALKKKAQKARYPKAEAKIAPQISEDSFEKRISKAESELGEVNAEIEADLLSANFSRMEELYKKKSQLEERIEALYSEWLEGGL